MSLRIAAFGQTPADHSLGLCEVDCDTDVHCQPGLLCSQQHKSALEAAGYSRNKADCTGDVGRVDFEVCFDPVILVKTGRAGIDVGLVTEEAVPTIPSAGGGGGRFLFSL
jgi:hypothetical protein